MSLLEGLQSSQIFFISFCTLFGLMVGSFLNVVIYRLPKMLERGWRRDCAELRGESLEALPPYNIVVPRSASSVNSFAPAALFLGIGLFAPPSARAATWQS